jgi:hypothetical protein
MIAVDQRHRKRPVRQVGTERRGARPRTVRPEGRYRKVGHGGALGRNPSLTVFPTIAPRVEYEFSKLGHTLTDPLQELWV